MPDVRGIRPALHIRAGGSALLVAIASVVLLWLADRNLTEPEIAKAAGVFTVEPGQEISSDSFIGDNSVAA